MLYAIVAVLILILDQGMKYFTTTNLPVETGVRELIPGLLQLRHVRNSGSAFSFLNDWPYARWLFLGVTALFVVLVILALSRRWIKGGFGRWMALFVLAGDGGEVDFRLGDMQEGLFSGHGMGLFGVQDVIRGGGHFGDQVFRRADGREGFYSYHVDLWLFNSQR